MKTTTILSVLCLVIAGSLMYCKKDAPFIPPCIKQKIDSIKNSSIRNPPAEIHVWMYRGRNVYLFNASCCNEFVRVVDQDCQYICSPSGGARQYGDSLCADFYQDARYVGSIFRDDR